jgi:GTPase SAR1 family protein
MSKEKDTKKEQLIRICIFGSAFSGKTALCNRFVNNTFEWVYEPTTQVNVFRKVVNITEDEEHQQFCMIQAEDLFPINHPYLQMPKESSKEVANMMETYDRVLGNKRPEKKKSGEGILFRETFIHGYMYVYDLNSKASLKELEDVIAYIHTREEKEAGKKKSATAAKILIGTKKDMCLSGTGIPQSEIDQVKKKYNLMARKVSALTNTEVTQAFLDLARNAIDKTANDEYGGPNDAEEDGGSFWSFLGCGDRDKKSSDQDEESNNNNSKCVVI